MDEGTWRVLTEAIFPNAQDPASVTLAMQYCKARGMDIMKRPVNIVPVWNAKLKKMVETIWVSINETQVTAARTGEWGGMDPPKFGPDATKTFKGRRWDDDANNRKGGFVDAESTVTFPEWCEVTVYRIKNGVRHPFTETVWWVETYGRQSGGDLPNYIWQKRPRGQFVKTAKAASLRAAFPEEGGYDESEIEGITLAPESPEPPKPRDDWKPPQGSPHGDQGRTQPDDHGRTGVDDSGPIPEPPPHTEAPEGPQGPKPPQTAGAEVVDGSTGEVVGPQIVAKNESEDWIAWAQRFLARVTTSKNEDEIKAWAEHNTATLEAMKKPEPEGGGPKVYDRMNAAINRHRMTFTGGGGDPPKQTIMSAG
jgi:phage recombination protein Bet